VPGDVLRQRSNAARSSSILKVALYDSATRGMKLRGNVSALSLITLKEGS
jgi:hypothetical protein